MSETIDKMFAQMYRDASVWRTELVIFAVVWLVCVLHAYAVGSGDADDTNDEERVFNPRAFGFLVILAAGFIFYRLWPRSMPPISVKECPYQQRGITPTDEHYLGMTMPGNIEYPDTNFVYWCTSKREGITVSTTAKEFCLPAKPIQIMGEKPNGDYYIARIEQPRAGSGRRSHERAQGIYARALAN